MSTWKHADYMLCGQLLYMCSVKERNNLIFLHFWDRADGYNADYVSFMKHIEISNFLLSWDGDRASGSRKTQPMNCSRISRCDFSRIWRERFFRDLQYKIFPPRWRWDPAKPKGRQTWGSMPQSLLIITMMVRMQNCLACIDLNCKCW